MENVIYSINGPVITVKNTKDFSMMEMVYVGEKGLVGEVISVNDKLTTIQVYESTTGLKPNEKVIGTKSPISVELGPGILRNIYDGIQRPLKTLEEKEGPFISSGSLVSAIDREQLWDVEIVVKVGDYLNQGDIFALVKETLLIEHRSMVPFKRSGEVIEAKASGKYNVDEVLVKIKDEYNNIYDLTLTTKWPIRKARPFLQRKQISTPLITGQRVLDSIFPIAKGGAACIPGGFGAGKTMLQHQIAKWCDADIIIYVGCGERGNEMTQVLEEFTSLIDPKSNRPLLDRTCLIANTSNMPVASREASIYTGCTIGEYYRDMGYNVAIMADSTSRWAEALREISARLEEMPAEEGYPAYLASRLASFYERASEVKTLNNRDGSLTIIGAVSPQGADFSEPVTQNTKRFIRSFWALDKSLAYTRHYPSVNWNLSYSEYIDDLNKYYSSNVSRDFLDLHDEIIEILHKENSLMEIVKLIGNDVLPEEEKLTLEIARVVRIGFLQQNSFDPIDTYVPLLKQYKMMKIISYLYKKSKLVINKKIPVSLIIKTNIFEDIIKIKYDVPNDKLELLDTYFDKIDVTLEGIK